MMASEPEKTYAEILRKYLFGNREEALLEAYDFATRLARSDLPPEELVALHEDALMKVQPTVPSFRATGLVIASFELLLEAMIAYGLELKSFRDRERSHLAELERMALYVRSMTDPLWVLDERNRTVDVNPAFTRVFGYERDEIAGRPVFEFVDEENRQIMETEFREKRDRGIASTYEIAVRAKDGTNIPVLISGAPIMEGERVIGKIGVLKDMRQLKGLEEELERRNRQLKKTNERILALYTVSSAVSRSLDVRVVLEAALNALRIVAPDHTMSIYLKRASRLVLEDYRNLSDDFVAHIRERGLGEGLVGATVLSGQSIVIQEGLADDPRISEKSREYIQRENLGAAAFFPLKAKGEIFGALAVMARSPHQFCSEELNLLRSLVDQIALGIENARLHERLVAQNVQFQEASQHKSEFLASMSHELRTPLNAIIGFSEILREQTFGSLNEKQIRYVDHVHNAGQHLLDLINDVLDLSKIEAGKMDLHRELFVVREGLEEALATVRSLASKRKIDLTLTVDPDLGVLEADRRRFKQVILNLLSNALKFTGEGGKIRVQAEKVEEFVQVSIVDTGIGIAPEDLERIFDVFEQAEQALTRQHEGTGLGLALVKRIMELHEGHIYVDSQVGRGSTFTVAFPLPRIQGPPPEWSEVVQEVVGETAEGEAEERPRILVIEDDPRAAELIATHLRAAGMATICALSGEEGLARARTDRPRAIILDLLMPVMDGWRVLEALREDPRTNEIPVVIVTIVDRPANVAAMGVAGYFVKPWNRVALLGLIRRLVGQVDPGAAPIRILVIDDDPAVHELIGEPLRAAGYVVTGAETGLDGLAQAQADPPGAIILDIIMPDISGLEVLTYLRDDPRTRDIPVVIFSSHELTDEEKEFVASRVQALVPKQPDGLEQVLGQLQRILGAG